MSGQPLAFEQQAFQPTEQVLCNWAAQLQRHQHQLHCREARLKRDEAAWQSEKRRLIAFFKERVAYAYDRYHQSVRLRRRQEDIRQAEVQRLTEKQDMCEKARQLYLRKHETMTQRLAELDRRECELAGREAIVAEIELDLAARDPKPVNAQREIDRRKKQWETLANKPLNGIKKQKKELEEWAAYLQSLYEKLLDHEQRLEQERAACSHTQTALELEQTAMLTDRARWEHQTKALQADRENLLDHVKELEQEIERLAVSFMDRTPSGLEIAAAA